MLRENGFRKGDDVIALSYIPGLVYAIGGVSPGHPTFISSSVGPSNKYTEIALGYADIERLKKAFVIVNTEPDPVIALLQNRGLEFPIQYKHLDNIKYLSTYYSVYKPVGVNEVQ